MAQDDADDRGEFGLATIWPRQPKPRARPLQSSNTPCWCACCSASPVRWWCRLRWN